MFDDAETVYLNCIFISDKQNSYLPQAMLLLLDRSTAETECWPSWLLPTTHACDNIIIIISYIKIPNIAAQNELQYVQPIQMHMS